VQLRRGARTSQEAEPATLGLMTPKREQTHTKTPTHARSWPSVALRAFSVATSCGRWRRRLTIRTVSLGIALIDTQSNSESMRPE